MAASSSSFSPTAAQADGRRGGTANSAAASMTSAQLNQLQETLLIEDSLEESGASPGRPRATLDFEDRREERRRCGVLKWQIEKGVPDVGGLGWRSRTGHLLKNQTFYATKPNENMWDNPTHAGPKSWKEYHGPKLRSDAPLMGRLDRLDAEQEEFEAKKAYVNTTRVQTLDRFYHAKTENYQKEIASQWAPHRRARREVHQAYDSFSSELNSMPQKELKKVLTPAVLKADREAVRNIAKRVQVEETWKAAWKQMEVERREDTRAMHEQRRAYNEMLMELSGQRAFRPQEQPPPQPKNSCTKRVEELAKPVGPRGVAAATGDVTHLVDFAGLVHVDHKLALEVRFPGVGHAMSTNFTNQATESTKAGWPPPPPAETPTPGRRGGRGARGEQQQQQQEQPQHSTSMESSLSLRRGSLPVSKERMSLVRQRTDCEALSTAAIPQFLATSAPPPPDHRDQIVHEALVNDPKHMSRDLEQLQTSRDRLAATSQQHRDMLELSPARHSTVYPVVVPSAEATMERPSWRPRRASTMKLDQHGDAPAAATASAPSGASGGAPRSARGRWPPPGCNPVSVRIVKASKLPRADRAGHSDPYCVCQVSGKARSKVKTRVVEDSENPLFDEEHLVAGWRKGDSLVFSIFDHDVAGADDKLAEIEVPSSMFFPKPYAGVLKMKNLWSAAGQRVDGDMKKYNSMAVPELEISIDVQAIAPDPDSSDEDAMLTGRSQAYQELAMPNAEPSMRAVCDHLDDFHARTPTVPRLGNFWMQPDRLPGGAPLAGARSAR